MAMIQKIRDQKILLLIIIGGAMILFLITSLLTGPNLFSDNGAGSANGVTISLPEYQSALDNRRSLGFTGDGLADEVWNDIATDIVLADEFSSIGLTVTNEEFEEIIFGDIDSGYMSRAFYSNGPAKENWVNNFNAMLSTDEGKKMFIRYKNVIISKRKREKFEALINKGVYANSLEGKYDYLHANNKSEFRYVVKLFKNIPDSAVNVTESDVMDYFNDHKSDKEFEQKNEGRDITLIKIPFGASVEDIDAINKDLQDLKDSWSNFDDKKAFAESDVSGTVTSVRKSMVETNADESSFFDVKVGSMVGPYSKGDQMIVANVLGRTMVPDTAASVRHILLQAKDVNDAYEMAKLNAKADSLVRVIKGGQDFGTLAARYSDDPGSKSNGGVYEFFPQGQMVKPFNDFSFNRRVGSIGSVETSYGVHVIEVLDRRYKIEEAEVAFITRQIAASDSTRRNTYKEAIEFAVSNETKEEIVTAAEEAGFVTSEAVNIIRGAKSLSGIRNASEIVNWVYRAEEGEISHPIKTDKQYVIVVVDMIKKKGEPQFAAVEEQMRSGAIKQAKGELYAELMNGNNLEEIAEVISEPVRTAFNANMKTSAVSGSGAGAEPIVVGSSFSIPEGNMSNPIIGESGIWVIAPKTVTPADEKTDFLEEQTALVTRAKSGLSIAVTNGMNEAAGVEDNRYK